MTKDEAIRALHDGYKLTHKSFTKEEWVKNNNDEYEFEDGCICSRHEFWNYRTEDTWAIDWSIFKEIT